MYLIGSKRLGTSATRGPKAGQWGVTFSAPMVTLLGPNESICRLFSLVRALMWLSACKVPLFRESIRASGGRVLLQALILEVLRSGSHGAESLYFLLFLDPMWVILTVVEQGTIELTEQLSHFNELGAIPPLVPQVPNPFIPHYIHRENKVLNLRGRKGCCDPFHLIFAGLGPSRWTLVVQWPSAKLLQIPPVNKLVLVCFLGILPAG